MWIIWFPLIQGYSLSLLTSEYFSVKFFFLKYNLILKQQQQSCTAQKMKFSIKDFSSNVTKSAGHAQDDKTFSSNYSKSSFYKKMFSWSFRIFFAKNCQKRILSETTSWRLFKNIVANHLLKKVNGTIFRDLFLLQSLLTG